ncbi:hypothetical protein ACH5RR_012600 [Cinchona calisaya]|uniref:Reverse transcriptase zinc-binding domain-containing protein n=1 Tax=Cinchona calisaya TaxID=153742 RepID=A0ABD3A9P9_9GENT
MDCTVTTVDQLITGNKCNLDLLNMLFSPLELETITQIPISLTRKTDRWYWNYSSSGVYTVNSTYKALKTQEGASKRKHRGDEETSRSNEQAILWKFTWGLNVKHKIRHVLWKCLNNILPTNANIHRRTGKGYS